jgi:hypothetical protein
MGPDLDAQIAEHVMGHMLQYDPVLGGIWRECLPLREDPWRDCRRYSSSYQWAMTALETWHGDYEICRQNSHYRVELFEPSMQYDAWAETLPLAICRALLRAWRDKHRPGPVENDG